MKLLPAENLGKRIIKTPKLYFLDTGLACYLAGIRAPSALLSSGDGVQGRRAAAGVQGHRSPRS